MRVFSDRLRLKVDEKGRPLAFSLIAKGRYPANYKVVNILRWWREPGRWWEGEPVALYVRLQAVPGARGLESRVWSPKSGVWSQRTVDGKQQTVDSIRQTVDGRGPRYIGVQGDSEDTGYGWGKAPEIFELCRVRGGWYLHRRL